jgi:putative redox protein
MITTKLNLTQALKSQRQFINETGSGHDIILDDAAGPTGTKPTELVSVTLAGCTTLDVVTMLRQKHHQTVTAHDVRVEVNQAKHPPQVVTAISLHLITGFAIDETAAQQTIQMSGEKCCAAGAMLKAGAALPSECEIHEEPCSWLLSAPTPKWISA